MIFSRGLLAARADHAREAR